MAIRVLEALLVAFLGMAAACAGDGSPPIDETSPASLEDRLAVREAYRRSEEMGTFRSLYELTIKTETSEMGITQVSDVDLEAREATSRYVVRTSGTPVSLDTTLHWPRRWWVRGEELDLPLDPGTSWVGCDPRAGDTQDLLTLARVFGDLSPATVTLLELTSTVPAELEGEPMVLYTGTVDEEAAISHLGSLVPTSEAVDLPPGSIRFSIWIDEDGLVARATIEIALDELEPGARLRQSTSFWDYGEELDVSAPPRDDVTWLGSCADAVVSMPTV